MVIVVWEVSIRKAWSRLGSDGFAAAGCGDGVAVAVAADGEDEDEDDKSDSRMARDFTGPWSEDEAMDEDEMDLFWRWW